MLLATTKPQRGAGTQPRVSTRGITYAIENTSPKGAQENNLNSSVFYPFPVVFFLRPYRALFMGGDLFPGLKPRAVLRRPCGTLTIGLVSPGLGSAVPAGL